MRLREISSVFLFGAAVVALSTLSVSSAAQATARPVAAASEVEAPARSASPASESSALQQPATGPEASSSASAPTGAPVETAAAKAKPLPPTLVARINLTTQTMSVQAGSKTLHTWKVSSGAPGYATPPGTFKPGWMAKMWYSRQYDDAPMPHSVFFNGGIAVHATTSIHNLGRPASHGCVRLAPANAEKFYNLVTRHGMTRTRIVVFGSQPFSTQTDRIAKLNKQYERRKPQVARAPVPATLWYMMPPGYGASSYAPYGGGYMQSANPPASGYRTAAAPRRTATAPARRSANSRLR